MNPFINMYAAPEVPYVLGFVVVVLVALFAFIAWSQK